MNGLSVNQDAFSLKVTVPEDLVGMPAEGEGEWAAWHGVSCAGVDGRDAVVLVSITVAPFHPEKSTVHQGENTGHQGKSTGDALAARLRAKHADDGACVEQFATADGNPGVSVRRVVTQPVNGRDVTTGQAQAFVAYPGAGALGVISAVALDPDDLDRAAELVTGIAAGMTVTGASAAA